MYTNTHYIYTDTLQPTTKTQRTITTSQKTSISSSTKSRSTTSSPSPTSSPTSTPTCFHSLSSSATNSLFQKVFGLPKDTLMCGTVLLLLVILHYSTIVVFQQ